jgi:NCAIR mutase (PurE)-related protein
MDKNHLERILKNVKKGSLSISDALSEFKHFPYKDMKFVKVDHHRSLRKGFPEVVFCEGKTVSEAFEIIQEILRHGKNLLATRASLNLFEQVRKIFPEALYHERARVIAVQKNPIAKKGLIVVLSAGTADIPVAEEAALTAEIMGNKVERIYDVGVAGIHRLFDHLKGLDKACVLIVVAGMEGALPSVVAGLVNRLVIAVPTSVGYGANFGGIAPLLAMLNSCASGVTVMNIDNGFGAGFAASLVNQL